MKTIGLLTAAVLLLPHGSPAQMRIGLTGGLHFSEAEQTRFYNARASSSTKYALAGILEYSFSRNLSLLVEPTYLEKGTSAEPLSFGGAAARLSLDLSYLEVPLLVKYSVGGHLRPYVFMGPAVGINLSSRLRADVRAFGLGQLEVETSARDIVRDFEYSLQIGGGLSYQVDEIIALFFEARYSYGINNIARNAKITATFLDEIAEGQLENDPVYRNKGFRIMFGFTFPLRIGEL
jgi:opacity protein-like surface antigen